MKTLRGKKVIFHKKSILSPDSIEKNMLESRNISSEKEEEFFNGTLEHLHNPNLLPDIKKSWERIASAQAKKERIMVFGDYDVDGITSTMIMYSFLKDDIGLDISYRLPDRVHDGYGLKQYFIDEMKDLGVTLLICVDCGTKDGEILTHAKNLGIDTIVIDHHHVPDDIDIEPFEALINPKRIDSDYPFIEMSASALVWKVCTYWCEILLPEKKQEITEKYIDIAALGTVSDCMPLIDENRIITKYGLEKLPKSESTAIRNFIKESDREITSTTISHYLGPLINATGRMKHPKYGLHMLRAKGKDAIPILEYIKTVNEERKNLTKLHVSEALHSYQDSKNIIFHVGENIPHGVIGLIAGQMTEMYHKPSIICTKERDKYVCSCRSPEYFSIIEALEYHKKYLEKFGGHKQAAGCTIHKKNIHALENSLHMYVEKKIRNIDTTPTISCEGYLKTEHINPSLLEKINSFAPFGIGNPEPLFAIRIPRPEISRIGKTKEHIKFQSGKVDFIGFFMEDLIPKILKSHSIVVLGKISKNNWNGKIKTQVQIVDII